MCCTAKIKPPRTRTTCMHSLTAILYHLVQILDSIDLTALHTTAVVIFPSEVTLKEDFSLNINLIKEFKISWGACACGKGLNFPLQGKRIEKCKQHRRAKPALFFFKKRTTFYQHANWSWLNIAKPTCGQSRVVKVSDATFGRGLRRERWSTFSTIQHFPPTSATKFALKTNQRRKWMSPKTDWSYNYYSVLKNKSTFFLHFPRTTSHGFKNGKLSFPEPHGTRISRGKKKVGNACTTLD